jgi:hypothetical protein
MCTCDCEGTYGSILNFLLMMICLLYIYIYIYIYIYLTFRVLALTQSTLLSLKNIYIYIGY